MHTQASDESSKHPAAAARWTMLRPSLKRADLLGCRLSRARLVELRKRRASFPEWLALALFLLVAPPVDADVPEPGAVVIPTVCESQQIDQLTKTGHSVSPAKRRIVVAGLFWFLAAAGFVAALRAEYRGAARDRITAMQPETYPWPPGAAAR